MKFFLSRCEFARSGINFHFQVHTTSAKFTEKKKSKKIKIYICNILNRSVK